MLRKTRVDYRGRKKSKLTDTIMIMHDRFDGDYIAQKYKLYKSKISKDSRYLWIKRGAAYNDEVVYYYIIHHRCARAESRSARHSSMIIFHIKVISGLDNK